MAASTKSKTASDSELEEFFPEGGSPEVEDDFADVDDLLNDVEEDDSEGWVPKEKGEGIAGKLMKISITKSDFAKDGEDADCPTWTILTASGDKWRVIGYGAVLKREMNDAQVADSTAPKGLRPVAVGDKVAVKYFGEKTLKTGKFAGRPYKHFGIAARASN